VRAVQAEDVGACSYHLLQHLVTPRGRAKACHNLRLALAVVQLLWLERHLAVQHPGICVVLVYYQRQRELHVLREHDVGHSCFAVPAALGEGEDGVLLERPSVLVGQDGLREAAGQGLQECLPEADALQLLGIERVVLLEDGPALIQERVRGHIGTRSLRQTLKQLGHVDVFELIHPGGVPRSSGNAGCR